MSVRWLAVVTTLSYLPILLPSKLQILGKRWDLFAVPKTHLELHRCWTRAARRSATMHMDTHPSTGFLLPYSWLLSLSCTSLAVPENTTNVFLDTSSTVVFRLARSVSASRRRNSLGALVYHGHKSSGGKQSSRPSSVLYSSPEPLMTRNSSKSRRRAHR